MYSDAFNFNSTLHISKLNKSKNHKALLVASLIAVIFVFIVVCVLNILLFPYL